ncbi:DUF4160 domain-containing protein [Herbiconiux sp. L3-i23]|uniref:DUF4160 domain-containing protein n=1 Tax=Herbiconiux sp. L3-i23 TaxID=2905871 RepID=UPI00204AAC14|nr:DUF4160 domain-containing protein [Herbiconiux sp. L3-i23]BDI22903.1 hypothetical protein L3i23_16790 [Herbiconiux sp. L3-i23]
MLEDDLTPYERAERNLNEPAGWALAEDEGRLEDSDILSRLVRMALFEFGEGKETWPAAFDEEGFLTALTAEGRRFDGGISVHVWPNDHPPPHVHILKKSEPDNHHLRISLETGDPLGDLPPWVDHNQLKRIKALIAKHHQLLEGWWEKHHEKAVTLLE